MSTLLPPVGRNAWERASLVFGNGFLTRNARIQALKPLSAAGEFVFSRASGKNVRNAQGVWTPIGANEPPVDFDPITGRWALPLERGAVNGIGNPTMAGAAIGTPGALPTNWSQPSTGGLSREIVGLGTENGLNFIDIRWFGTANATVAALRMGLPTAVVASLGQTWTHSNHLRMISAVQPPINFQVAMYELTAAGTYLTEGGINILPQIDSTLRRFSFTRTLSNASVARVEAILQYALINGQSYNFTIRIAWPQIELGSFATSPINGTRAADVTALAGATALIGQTSGWLAAEVDLRNLNAGQMRCILSLSDNTMNNRIGLNVMDNNSRIQMMVNSGGVEQANIITASPFTGRARIAAAYAPNDIVMFVNGTQIGTDTSATIPACNRINLGSLFDGTGFLNDRLEGGAIGIGRPTNAFLQQLSTL
ncbi:MAG: hypothetical protein C0424_10380 [Sphingobacteriaceae bacterium]|nr:hypothetical protein [Sphingobacteriaceae bacterium]